MGLLPKQPAIQKNKYSVSSLNSPLKIVHSNCWNSKSFLTLMICMDVFYVKFLDAGIQDVSTSISIVQDLIEMSPDDDESDKRI